MNLVFRSGMSSQSDFAGARDAGVPVGVVAGHLSTNQLVLAIPRYLDVGGRVFIDSGAFTAFRTNEDMDWDDVMSRYDMVATLTNFPQHLYIVSPDVVGNQFSTLKLIAQWQKQLLSLIHLGVNVIVPLQAGVLAGQQMIKQISTLFGTDVWIAGVPSNSAAMTIKECATLSHPSFHILGRVQVNEEQIARLEALRTHSPDAVISADANWLRSRIAAVSKTTHVFRESQHQQTKHSLSHPRTQAIASLIQADNWGALPVFEA